MSRRLLAEIGKTQRITILETLKRKGSLSVGDLSKILKMSYMGVKQHCIQLHKSDYLDTWRKPSTAGRPQMLYRLTQKAHELYERPDNHFSLALLEASKKLFGAHAAEKLLFQVFQTLSSRYADRIRGESPEARARAFAKLRDEEGYVSEFVSQDGEISIVEHHHPYLELLEHYPSWERMETEMVQKLIGARIRRTAKHEGGVFSCEFALLGR